MASSSPPPKKQKKNIKYKILIIILLITIFPIVFTINQYSNIETNNNTNISNNTKILETISYKVYNVNNHVACASAFIQINNNSYVYGYRRDANDPSDQYINEMNFDKITDDKNNGNTRGTLFVHSVISNNGWCFGIGGLDNPMINKKIEKIGASMIMKGNINFDDMNSIYKYIKLLGIGHFAIKSPEGYMGVISCFNGNTKMDIFKLENGDYVIVPNNPSFFDKGTVSNTDSISGVFHLLSHDKYGVNRRNDLVYSVLRTNNTKVDVYVSNDDGRYIERNDATFKDDVIFNGKRTDKNSIPLIPEKLYLGNTFI
jgi:hypothetical protein